MRHKYEEDKNFTPDMSFGDLLRKSRRLMGYNQTDFAEMFGVSQHTISFWENGDYTPTLENARYILKRLGFKMVFVKDGDFSENS